MIVLNLACSHDHRFEGWFGSAHDFETQQTQGLLSCPLCADKSIRRMPTAARLNVSKSREDTQLPQSQGRAKPSPSAASQTGIERSPKPVSDEAPASAQADLGQLQGQVLRAVREWMAKTEDVGTQFAEEARRMHYGEAEERAIRGQSNAEELQALSEEGIEVLALPIAPGLAETLQ